jgi:transcriptional regulator with PAS, ATPase and Fis domain
VARFNRLQGRNVPGISPEALSLIMAHGWPGNIRELENVIERAFILCGDDEIHIQHLPREVTGRSAAAGSVGGDLKSVHDILDAQAISAALERNQQNRTAAARELGIHKTTLYRRMKKLGLT